MNLALSFALLCFVLLPLAGFLYERLAAMRHFDPPGKRVDAGGCRLHILCMGEDHTGPTVVLEGGAGGYSLEWDLVQRLVSEFARVCSYDRAGYGWSDTGTVPRTGAQIADELNTLLLNAAVPPPYILVGHSLGGYFVREYARRYSHQVAGMVLIDSVHPHQWKKVGLSQTATARNMKMMGWLSQVGLLRFAAWQKIRRLAMAAEAKAAYPALIARGILNAVVSEVESVQDEENMVGLLGDKPLCVVTRTPQNTAFGRMLTGFQMDFIGLSSRGSYHPARKSNHYVHLEEPALVVAAIRQVVEQVKQK